MSNCRPEFQNEAVLLVEDNPTNQFAVFQMLEAAKLNVDIASNGSIALRVLERREDFRLVLMDVEMPVMDGLRASREIRTIWPDRELPIIGLTANSGPAELQACLDAGMSEVLTKPVRRQDLLATLARWLGTSKDMADGPIHSDAMVLDRPDLPGIKVKEAMTRLGSPWEMLRDMLLQLGDSLPQRLVNLEQA
ncbi:MAG: response regulator, partial [Limisphaerales bacterium]